MLNKGFTIILERWIVIPFIGTLISHGLITQGDSSFWVVIIDNVLGGLFIIGAWVLTHKTLPSETADLKLEQQTLWQKVLSFVWNSKTPTTTQPMTTIPSTEVAQ